MTEFDRSEKAMTLREELIKAGLIWVLDEVVKDVRACRTTAHNDDVAIVILIDPNDRRKAKILGFLREDVFNIIRDAVPPTALVGARKILGTKPTTNEVPVLFMRENDCISCLFDLTGLDGGALN